MSVAELPNRSPEFERVPPHDVVAEQGVLGGMMLSKEIRNSGSAQLSGPFFLSLSGLVTSPDIEIGK